jgi:hypothetical protein
LAMNPWIAKAVVLAGTVVMIVIRAPTATEVEASRSPTAQDSARDRPLGSRVGRILRPSDLGPSDLDRVAGVLVR